MFPIIIAVICACNPLRISHSGARNRPLATTLDMTSIFAVKYPGATRPRAKPMFPGASSLSLEDFMRQHPVPKDARDFLLAGSDAEDEDDEVAMCQAFEGSRGVVLLVIVYG